MKLELLRKDVFGRVRYYGLNHEAKTICKLLDKKTLNQEHINICREAEWEVVIQYPED